MRCTEEPPRERRHCLTTSVARANLDRIEWSPYTKINRGSRTSITGIPMNRKRLLLGYLSGYLLFGGLGLAFAPDIALDLLQSDVDYGDVMPRVVGMFMVALGALIALFVIKADYTYYRFSIVARTGIVAFLFYLYTIDTDPMFLVFNAIVLVGLIPSYVVLVREMRE